MMWVILSSDITDLRKLTMFQLNRLNNPSITLLENHGTYKISNADENLEEDHTFGYERNRSSVEW